MAERLAADGLVLLHLAFIVFVALGGLLAAWRPRLAWLHLPAVAWGAWIEAAGAICPLTPWENRLRRAACIAFAAQLQRQHRVFQRVLRQNVAQADTGVLQVEQRQRGTMRNIQPDRFA